MSENNQKNIKKAVAIIVQRGEKLLLLKESINKSYEKGKERWSFPLGKVEGNEDILNAAYRELKEETGMSGIFDFKINGLFFLNDKTQKNKYILGTSFFCKLPSFRKIKINKENKTMWFKIGKIKECKLRQNMEVLIENYEQSKFPEK